MTTVRRLIIACCIVALPGIAASATLRPVVTLESNVVRLSDLFDDAGPGAERVLGPAPVPGTRIVVESSQLSAIARQFGVDWRAASPADRTLIDRRGRMVPREDVLAALRAALNAVGAPEDATMELPGFTAPLVPAEATTEAGIEQLDYDAGTLRFTATLAITGADMATQRMRLSGRLEEHTDLPVPTHRILQGTVIGPEDLHMVPVRSSLIRGEVVRTAAQALGMVLRHPAVPGQPVLVQDLARPPAVLKGARVTMELQTPGLSLVAQGQALENGALGERISILNPASRAVVVAEIIAGNRVRVAPDSPPTILPAGAATQVAVR